MIKILMDCDVGTDDAAAISLAVASDKLELLGITACMGNLALEHTLENALQLMDHFGLDVPVAKGSHTAMIREHWDAGFAAQLPIPGIKPSVSKPHELSAVEFMAKTLRESDEKITLVPLAPLTNIAKLILQYPDLVNEKVDQIVMMGGGMYFGNTTGAAELNFYADPEAAAAVFEFGKPIKMFGLDVCHKAWISRDANDAVKKFSSKPAIAYHSIVDHSIDESVNYPSAFAGEGCLMYDTLPIVYLVHPEIFTMVPADIKIETSSELCDGMSVCDTRNHDSNEKKHFVVLDIDRQGYFDAVNEIFGGLE